MTHRIVDATTGTVTDRPLTDEELARRDADAAAWQQMLADRAARTPDVGEDAADVEQGAPAIATALRAYLALGTPTGGQTTAAVRLLCRVALWLIRRQFDGAMP